jgi:hypothetical protein
VTSATVFADADASADLRACVAGKLVGATLPVVPHMTPQPIEITFAATH